METSKPRRILVIDDEVALRRLFERFFESKGYRVDCAGSGEEGLRLYDSSVDVVLLDFGLPGMTGMDVIRLLRERDPGAQIILMTGYASLETAVQALEWGVTDYVQKPLKVEHVDLLVQRHIEVRRLREENRRLRAELQSAGQETGLVGESAKMRELIDLIGRIAPTDATVLIHGESGVGKEIAARALHQLSRRHDRAFLTINCAALSETLLESELFGYEKGAFTGADRPRDGLLAAADGGTFFLDEIGDMSLALQSKLLRAVQEGEFIPVGGRQPRRVDIRFVAATHKRLSEEVKAGRFRQDLYFRLNIVNLDIPPLRERRSDIPLLANLFLERCTKRMHKEIEGFARETMNLLARYDWPGNVRELENVVERGVAIDVDGAFGPDDLPRELQAQGLGGPDKDVDSIGDGAGAMALTEYLDACERRHIERVLHATGGSIKASSQELGVNEKTLYLKMKRHGLRKEPFRSRERANGPKLLKEH